METVITGMSLCGVDTTKEAAPEWIKIAPKGAITARDGREFVIDPALLVERFNSDAIMVPIDVDHATVKKAAAGDSAPAVGWIEELQAREDGLWGRVSWLKEGLRTLADKTHRYISPTFKTVKETGLAVWLHSAALVAAPALSMPAVASAETTTQGVTPMLDPKIAQALGVDVNASADDIAAKVAQLNAQADTTSSLIAGLGSVMKSLAGQVVVARDKRIEARVDQAIAKGSATPALRDFCITLANTDETLLEEFCAKMGTPWAHLQGSPITPEMEEAVNRQRADTPVTLNSESHKLARQLGIDVKHLA